MSSTESTKSENIRSDPKDEKKSYSVIDILEFKRVTSYSHDDVNLCVEDWNDLFRTRMMDIIHFERKEKRSSDIVFAYFMDKLKVTSPVWYKISSDDVYDKKDGTKKTPKQFFFERISLLLQCVEHDKTEEMVSQIQKIVRSPKNKGKLPSFEDYKTFCSCFLYGLTKGHSNFSEKVRNAWIRLINYYSTKMEDIYAEVDKPESKID